MITCTKCGIAKEETLIGYGNNQKELTEIKESDILYRDWETDRKSTRLNSSHSAKSRMPSSA